MFHPLEDKSNIDHDLEERDLGNVHDNVFSLVK